MGLLREVVTSLVNNLITMEFVSTFVQFYATFICRKCTKFFSKYCPKNYKFHPVVDVEG